MKLVQKVQIKNDLGIHTRPATMIVKLLQDCKSQVFFTYKKDTINAKSILSILMLAARKNTQITLSIEGPDAKEVLERLVSAFETGFGEC